MLAALIALLQAAAPSVDRLVAEAAPIALVRIEKVHAVSQIGKRMDVRAWPEEEVRVAEGAIERTLLGDPEAKRIFFTLRVPRAEAYELEVGDRVVVFGDPRPTDFDPSTSTRAYLDRLTNANLFVPLTAGVWRIRKDAQGERVEWPLSIASLPKSLDERRVGAELPLATFVDWLDREIERTIPSLEAEIVTMAPCPWHMKLSATGDWDASNWLKPRKGKIDSYELGKLWQLIDDVRFVELPRQIGTSPAPETVLFIVRTRRRDGLHEVRIYSFLGEHPTAKQRDELARANRVWDALPGQEPR